MTAERIAMLVVVSMGHLSVVKAADIMSDSASNWDDENTLEQCSSDYWEDELEDNYISFFWRNVVLIAAASNCPK